MGDYPDWSRLVQLIGSDIKVPIDVQAQYVTLDINIAASAVTLDINLAASAVTLDIDIIAQSVGVYLQADWSALQGTDKNLSSIGNVKTFGQAALLDYTVPTGKTFYTLGLSAAIYPNAAADYDHFIRVGLVLANQTDALYLASIGGESGCSLILNKPIAIAADKLVRLAGTNYSDIEVGLDIVLWGYEI